MKTHKIEIGIILVALILVSCIACSKENKTVPAMATVSSDSVSSDIGVSSLVDSVASSAEFNCEFIN